MNKKTDDENEMLSEYDFTGVVRGKYVVHVAERTNVVVLEPDVSEVLYQFRIGESGITQPVARHSRGRQKKFNLRNGNSSKN